MNFKHPLASRPDLSAGLIHFTKGTRSEARENLRSIVRERRLLGGSGYIKANCTCVCFTEAPVDALADVYWYSRNNPDLKYQPFGIMVTKRWLFARGGRPVIYQPDSEFPLLTHELRYRHVRYEPTRDPPIDFTWEREWRIETTELRLDPAECSIVVPSDADADVLRRDFDETEDHRVTQLGIAVGNDLIEAYRESFPWQTVLLDAGPAEIEEAQRRADMGFMDR